MAMELTQAQRILLFQTVIFDRGLLLFPTTTDFGLEVFQPPPKNIKFSIQILKITFTSYIVR